MGCIHAGTCLGWWHLLGWPDSVMLLSKSGGLSMASYMEEIKYILLSLSTQNPFKQKYTHITQLPNKPNVYGFIACWATSFEIQDSSFDSAQAADSFPCLPLPTLGERLLLTASVG